MDLIVGMGKYIMTDSPDDTLNTYALASCVGITAYSPSKKAAGMLHIVLPTPLRANDRVERPNYFAETGIPLFINRICRKFGCRKEELQVQVYGGSNTGPQSDIYHIAEKNIQSVQQQLHDMGVKIGKTDLRGSESRSISMEVRTGRVKVYKQPMAVELTVEGTGKVK